MSNSNRESKKAFSHTSKVRFNEALMEALGVDARTKLRPGDEVTYGSVLASPTAVQPWSGNLYKYSFGNSKQHGGFGDG